MVVVGRGDLERKGLSDPDREEEGGGVREGEIDKGGRGERGERQRRKHRAAHKEQDTQAVQGCFGLTCEFTEFVSRLFFCFFPLAAVYRSATDNRELLKRFIRGLGQS